MHTVAEALISIISFLGILCLIEYVFKGVIYHRYDFVTELKSGARREIIRLSLYLFGLLIYRREDEVRR